MTDPLPTEPTEPTTTPPATPPGPIPLTAAALAADLAVRLAMPLPIAPRVLADKCGLELAPSPGSPFDVRFFPHTIVIYDPNASPAVVDEMIASGACAHLLHHAGHLRDLGFRELAAAVCGVTLSPEADLALTGAVPHSPPPAAPVVFTPHAVPVEPPSEEPPAPEEPDPEEPSEPTDPEPQEPPVDPEDPGPTEPTTPTDPPVDPPVEEPETPPEEPPTTP